jgi:hypothetical protein
MYGGKMDYASGKGGKMLPRDKKCYAGGGMKNKRGIVWRE